jgi:hypothetical protein
LAANQGAGMPQSAQFVTSEECQWRAMEHTHVHVLIVAPSGKQRPQEGPRQQLLVDLARKYSVRTVACALVRRCGRGPLKRKRAAASSVHTVRHGHVTVLADCRMATAKQQHAAMQVVDAHGS